MKWLILIWPFLAIISVNRNEYVERVAIIHALVSSYVSWGIITGIWSFPGTWPNNSIASLNEYTQWYGWCLWGVSLVSAFLAWMDRVIRFLPLSDARFPAKHRQQSYIFAFFGIWLIAFGGGYYTVPLSLSILISIAALSGGMNEIRTKETSNN